MVEVGWLAGWLVLCACVRAVCVWGRRKKKLNSQARKVPRGRGIGKANNDSCFCSDYINPIDLCNRLNAYIVPEAAVHGFLTFLFIINGYWVAIVLNLPMLAFNAKKCVLPFFCFPLQNVG